eukprot:GEMP01028061.1.p1 GENE.GEMP01028061.1~~GEMP01028061.1.p1  ORF type:complete len:588 (+),score=147.27 GEMP01028061.1:192-1955(+)
MRALISMWLWLLNMSYLYKICELDTSEGLRRAMMEAMKRKKQDRPLWWHYSKLCSDMAETGTMPAKDLSRCLLALSRMNVSRDQSALYDLYGRGKDAELNDWCRFSKAFALAGYFPHPFFANVLPSKVLRWIHQATPRSIADLSIAFAMSPHDLPEDVSRALQSAANEMVPSMTARQLAKTLWAFQRLGLLEPTFAAKLWKPLVPHLPDLSLRWWTRLALLVPDASTARRIAQIARPSASANPEMLCLMARNLAMSGVFDGSLWPFVEAVVEHLEKLSASAAANMIYALGVCGVQDEVVLEALTVRLETRDVGPVGAKSAIVGLNCLGVDAPPWLRRRAADTQYETRPVALRHLGVASTRRCGSMDAESFMRALAAEESRSSSSSSSSKSSSSTTNGSTSSSSSSNSTSSSSNVGTAALMGDEWDGGSSSSLALSRALLGFPREQYADGGTTQDSSEDDSDDGCMRDNVGPDVENKQNAPLVTVCTSVLRQENSAGLSDAIENLSDPDFVLARRLLRALPEDGNYSDAASLRLRVARRAILSPDPVLRPPLVRQTHLAHPNERLRVRAIVECILAGDMRPELRDRLT